MDRPYPPSSLLELSELSDFGIRLTPAPKVWDWLQAEIPADTGTIHNEDHAHLLDADIGVMWTSSSFEKQGRTVLGQTEQLEMRGHDVEEFVGVVRRYAASPDVQALVDAANSPAEVSVDQQVLGRMTDIPFAYLPD